MPPEEFNPFTQNLDKVGIYKIGQKIIGATVGLMLAVGAGGVLAQTNIASVAAVQMSDGTGASSVGWTGKPQMYSSYGALMFSGNGIAFNNLYGSWSFAIDVNNGVAIGGAFAMQYTPPANGLIVAGNVGIGTTNPTVKLTSNSDYAQLRLETNTNPTSYFTTLQSLYDSAHPFSMSLTSSSSTSEIIGVYSADGGVTKKTALMTGKVGIGTTAPNEKLEVSGKIRVGDGNGNSLQLFRGGGDADDYTLRVAQSGTYPVQLWVPSDSSTHRYFQIGYNNAGTFVPQTVIDGYNGSVGIGTLTPSAKAEITTSSNGQLRLSASLVDATANYGNFDVDSSGIITLTSVGTNSNIYLRAGTHSSALRVSPASIEYVGPTIDYTYFIIRSQAGAGNGYAAKLLLQNTNGAQGQFDMSDSGGGIAWYSHPSTLTMSVPSGYGMIFNANGAEGYGINILTTGVVKITQLSSAPTYVKGGLYFDTTLNKLRVGGATAWETVTSV